MPDIECLNNEIFDIKKAINDHSRRLDSLDIKIGENTKITERIEAGVGEALDLMKWGKTTRKVIFWLGSTIAGILALIEGVRHFK